MSTTGRQRYPVLIVGGGPVGLALSIMLSDHRIPHALIEKHPSTTNHPKARNLNIRTMEIVRQWGIEDQLREAALPTSWGSNITYVRSLAGRELGRMPTASFEGEAALDVSPTAGILSSQDVFEPIFLREAELSGFGDIEFGCELVSLDETALEDGVRATVRTVEDGTIRTIDADYVVGCDGWKSAVRQHMGVEMEGRSGIGHFVNVHFRADLSRFVDHRPAVLYFVANDEVTGVFQPLDGQERWLCQIGYDGSSDTLDSYDEERCLDWIARAIGPTDHPVVPEILGVGSWTMNATAASIYRSGRILLAGDSCHQLPPTGGFGMNTGIQDAHNLAWKLAYVIQGLAGDGLLDTYEDERRPVAISNAERSLDNSRMVGRINRVAADPDADDAAVAEVIAASKRYGNFLGMDLGFVYESAAVIPDGSEPPPVDDPITDYVPWAHPGHRAPHLLTPTATSPEEAATSPPGSSLDDYELVFTLVRAYDAEALEREFFLAAMDLDIGFGVHGREIPPEEETPSKYGTYDLEVGEALLVRPDGHIAWRGFEGVGEAIRQILDRQ